MRYFIYPYNTGSESARRLRDALQGKIIKLGDSIFNPLRRVRGELPTIINWGNSHTPPWMSLANAPVEILNHPEAVARAVDKVIAFDTLSLLGVPTLEYTTDVHDAQDWLGHGSKVYVRRTVTGHSGEGIETYQTPTTTPEEKIHNSNVQAFYELLGFFNLREHPDMPQYRGAEVPDLPRAPLYTRGINNTGEYRVHVFGGRVIDYRKKSRVRNEDGEVNEPTGEQNDVRTLGNGWVFRQDNLRRLERIEQLAINAISALGLDFGCVDIIKDENGDVFVLEVNSAPSLGEDRTRDTYVNAIREHFEEIELPDLLD